MNNVEKFIENSKVIYEKTWLKYKDYSSIVYKLELDYGIFILIYERNNCYTGEKCVTGKVYLNNTCFAYNIYTLQTLNIDMERIKILDIDDYFLNY